MLIGIILLVTAIVLAGLWYAETGERRRRNKEMARIASRIEQQKLNALKMDDNFDVTILWGDVITILDTLKCASNHTEGLQGLKDLALMIENENLSIQKQGECIKIKDIAHLQNLVDTYDSQINCVDYLNGSTPTFVKQKSEQESRNIDYDSKKDTYLAFASIASSKNEKVLDEISFYFDRPEHYFDKYYFDLSQRGIDQLADLTDVVVLVDALARQNKVAYQDWKTELYHSLEFLNQIVDRKLQKNSRYIDLIEQANISLLGLSMLEEKQGDGVFEAIKESGYKLLSIDEDSDSYALFLIPENEFNEIVELSKAANIKLHFVDRP